MRRIIASLSSAIVILGLLVGVAPGAQAAANPSSISLGYSGGQYVLSSETISALVGDTFTFVNNVFGQNVQLRNGSGGISVGGTTCTGANCTVTAGGGSATVRVDALGTFTINYSSFMTVTIVGSSGESGSAETDPALIYPTAYLNANGGTCTGTMQFTKYNGQNEFIILPTNETCTRSDYALLGWARTADATSIEWPPGTTVPIGTDSFTAYAVWRPNGLLLTYAANVGMDVACMKDGVNQSTSAERSVSRVITPASVGEAIRWDSSNTVRWTAATPAPVCSPPGYVFRGWSPTAAGQVPAASAVDTIITTFPGYPSGIVPLGNALTLYAQWGVTWGVGLATPSQSLEPGGLVTITATALRNGVADTGAPRQLQLTATGSVTFFGGATTRTITTNSVLGTEKVAVIASQIAGTGAVTASYGDATQTLEFTVASSQPQSIVITGERGSISGKSGIRVEGQAIGFRPGSKVIPWIRFPGETSFTAGSARPGINADGSVTWERKTGKRTAVYVTSEDGAVRSNTVVIAAQ